MLKVRITIIAAALNLFSQRIPCSPVLRIQFCCLTEFLERLRRIPAFTLEKPLQLVDLAVFGDHLARPLQPRGGGVVVSLPKS